MPIATPLRRGVAIGVLRRMGEDLVAMRNETRCLICGRPRDMHQGNGTLRCPVVGYDAYAYSDDSKQYFCTDRRVCDEAMVQIDLIVVPDDVVRDLRRDD